MKIRMRFVRFSILAGLMALAGNLGSLAAPSAALDISLTPIGRFTNGPPFGLSDAEIVAHDPGTQRLYVVNGRDIRLDVLDITDPTNPTKIEHIDLSGYGKVVNSVAVKNGLIAVAVEAAVKTDPGVVVFLNRNSDVLRSVTAGSLPDMVTFSPDGRWLLCANEGEPNTYNNFGSETNGPSVDPEGSVTIVDLASGVETAPVSTATFSAFTKESLPAGVRIYGPNATVAQDLEPEYIAVSDDSTTAWVTLQENNALAKVDIASATVTQIMALGTKDHNVAGNGVDASDQDGAINIRPWPIKGMYMPDSIAAYSFHGQTYLVMANEGDSRDWPGFREDVRVSTLKLDPTAFPNGDELKQTNNLGRLAVSKVDGDVDGDGDFDEIYAYGARSFSIRTAAGDLVFDSGDELEQVTAAMFPTRFNASHSNNTFDNRSTAKGPEPEGLAIGKVAGRTLAFVGLERIGGVAVYDISDPFDVAIVDYVNTRNFSGSFNFATAGDLGPEGVAFISADDSPNGKPLVVAAHEISGSTVIFQVNKRAFKREL
jgi:2',3'-cyclic-nucleotide 2'-phosphodiesterase/3'-nucleotidase/5'-nucleotidase